MIQATPDSTAEDFIRKTLDLGIDQLCAELRQRCAEVERLPKHPPLLESPLEIAFYRLWRMHMPFHDYYDARFILEPQVIVASTYRVDFKIALVSCPELERLESFPLICVELDGHDFHEKTKEQVTRRNTRDRDLMAAGWKIVRFSGSEFFRDPLGCVAEAYKFAYVALDGLLRAQYRNRKGVS